MDGLRSFEILGPGARGAEELATALLWRIDGRILEPLLATDIFPPCGISIPTLLCRARLETVSRGAGAVLVRIGFALNSRLLRSSSSWAFCN